MWNLIANLFKHRSQIKSGFDTVSKYKNELKTAYQYRKLIIGIIVFSIVYTLMSILAKIF